MVVVMVVMMVLLDLMVRDHVRITVCSETGFESCMSDGVLRLEHTASPRLHILESLQRRFGRNDMRRRNRSKVQPPSGQAIVAPVICRRASSILLQKFDQPIRQWSQMAFRGSAKTGVEAAAGRAFGRIHHWARRHFDHHRTRDWRQRDAFRAGLAIGLTPCIEPVKRTSGLPRIQAVSVPQAADGIGTVGHFPLRIACGGAFHSLLHQLGGPAPIP